MCNLEDLTLYVFVRKRAKFIGGTQLRNEILIHMPQLQTFTFYIKTEIKVDHSVPHTSNDEIRRTFTDIRFVQVDCIVHYLGSSHAVCHIFSLPFTSDCLELIGNEFPSIIFNNVTVLWVLDVAPFKHEFFVRIARSFPLMKSLRILNCTPQLFDADVLELDHSQSYLTVEYPHLASLDIMYVHLDYIEQFLHELKTRLPHLMELMIEYDKLQLVTENFTRDATRFNCSQVKRLIVNETIVCSKDFYLYFPLL